MTEYVGKFEKVPFEQFYSDMIKLCSADQDCSEDTIKKLIEKAYKSIVLPKRSTSGSAGYDFCIPFDLHLLMGDVVVIPTGIRCKLDSDYFLNIVPRSGLGFKYRVSLANTNGIIDSDYYGADNYGHIMIKIVYDGCYEPQPLNKLVLNSERGFSKYKTTTLDFKAGDRFVQGIILKYGLAEEEENNNKRTGGFGSTGLE